jgi:hypothetical protein
MLPTLPNKEDVTETVEVARWLSQKPRSSTELADRIHGAKNSREISILWSRLVDAWASTFEPSGRISEIHAEVYSDRDYSVQMYWSTVALDVDYLS